MHRSSWIALGLVALAIAGGFWLVSRHYRKQPVAFEASTRSEVLALPSNPTAGPIWDSAVTLVHLGDFQGAAKLFAKGGSQSAADAAWPQAEAECWAASGLPDSALSALERCLLIAPLSAQALATRRTCRLGVGFTMASTGQPWKGRQLGQAVLQDFPGDSEATLLLGYSQAMDGNSGSAETLLGRLVQEHPGVLQAYPILVQCAFWRGDAEAAKHWINELTARDPSSMGISAFRQKLQAMQSNHAGVASHDLRIVCQLTCPFGLESEVMESAQTAWNFLASQIGSQPTLPVNILIGGHAVAPEWAAASFDGQVHLPLEAASDPSRRETILRHELTHAFLAAVGAGHVPLWLNEGLAQYYQGARCTKLPNAASADWLDSLETRKTFLDLDEERAELAYNYSLAVSQELMELHTSTTLAKYLENLQNGLNEPEAFQKAFGDDYPHLSARIRARL